jgi:hypothetical protein
VLIACAVARLASRAGTALLVLLSVDCALARSAPKGSRAASTGIQVKKPALRRTPLAQKIRLVIDFRMIFPMI